MKRIILWIAAAVLLISGAGCSGEIVPEEENRLGAYGGAEEEEREVLPARAYISMIFYESMDTNPLTATIRENHELLKLVYSPLIRLNGALEAEYVLAESVTVEGTEATVVLKEGLKFSDGSAVTAADAAASIKTIQSTPDSPYYSRLENIQSCRAADERTLTIRLREEDVDFINCLDIPVMQEDGTAGCGPYQFSESGGEQILVPNPHYFTQPQIAEIRLMSPSGEERQNMFSVGLLDVYFTTAESEQVFVSGKTYQMQTYPGDNLLYLGINCGSGLLAQPEFRGLLSALTDREKLVENVLLDQAEASAYPFQPGWYKAAGLQQGSGMTDAEKEAAAEALGLRFADNILQDGGGNQIQFTLLVSNASEVHRDAAQAVADSFALYGIKINLLVVSREEYQTKLAEGGYELYLGEVKTGRTLNTALYTTGSAINYGGFSSAELEEAAAGYRQGTLTLEDYAGVFDRYTPVIPLAYRQGVLYVSEDIGTFQSTGSWAVYGDITKLTTKEMEIGK